MFTGVRSYISRDKRNAAGLTWLPSATPTRFCGLPRELKTPYGKFCSGKWLPGSTAMNDWGSAMPSLYDV